jgi:lipopolysaccharide/colanic/teichoic acid biosynthesis glycosyltransferase
VKRAFDVTVAAAGLIVLAPLLAAIALAIRVTMGPPVLFRQVRPGLGGRPFVLRKFRTLLPPREPGSEITDDSPARQTGLGSFLRASGFDELPELVNVLAGQMSLVGPRPLLMEYLPLYTAEQARRHDVLPGITGLAQVSGVDSWDRRLELDAEYAATHTFLLDLKILARTAAVVLRRDGGSGPALFAGSHKRGS